MRPALTVRVDKVSESPITNNALYLRLCFWALYFKRKCRTRRFLPLPCLQFGTRVQARNGNDQTLPKWIYLDRRIYSMRAANCACCNKRPVSIHFREVMSKTAVFLPVLLGWLFLLKYYGIFGKIQGLFLMKSKLIIILFIFIRI